MTNPVIEYNHRQTSLHVNKLAKIQVEKRYPEIVLCPKCDGVGFVDNFDRKCPYCSSLGYVDWVQRILMIPYPNIFRRRR